MNAANNYIIRPDGREHYFWFDTEGEGYCHCDDWPVSWANYDDIEVTLLLPAEAVLVREGTVPDAIKKNPQALKFHFEEEISSDPSSLHLVSRELEDGVRVLAIEEDYLQHWVDFIANSDAKLGEIVCENEALNIVEAQLVQGPRSYLLNDGALLAVPHDYLERFIASGTVAKPNSVIQTNNDSELQASGLLAQTKTIQRSFLSLLSLSNAQSFAQGRFSKPFPWLELWTKFKYLSVAILLILVVDLAVLGLESWHAKQRVESLRQAQLEVFRQVVPQGQAVDPYQQLINAAGRSNGLSFAELNGLIASVASKTQAHSVTVRRLDLQDGVSALNVYVETPSFNQLDQFVAQLGDDGLFVEVTRSQARGEKTTATLVIEGGI